MRGLRGRWGVVLDTPDPRALADFYVRLLGWRVRQDEPDWVTVEPPEGAGHLAFQQTPEYVRPVWPPQPGRQQMSMHLDLHVADLDEAVADALAAGARLAGHQPQDDVRVLLDPDGHPFCVFTEAG